MTPRFINSTMTLSIPFLKHTPFVSIICTVRPSRQACASSNETPSDRVAGPQKRREKGATGREGLVNGRAVSPPICILSFLGQANWSEEFLARSQFRKLARPIMQPYPCLVPSLVNPKNTVPFVCRITRGRPVITIPCNYTDFRRSPFSNPLSDLVIAECPRERWRNGFPRNTAAFTGQFIRAPSTEGRFARERARN